MIPINDIVQSLDTIDGFVLNRSEIVQENLIWLHFYDTENEVFVRFSVTLSPVKLFVISKIDDSSGMGNSYIKMILRKCGHRIDNVLAQLNKILTNHPLYRLALLTGQLKLSCTNSDKFIV